jgi:hypothetical protein
MLSPKQLWLIKDNLTLLKRNNRQKFHPRHKFRLKKLIQIKYNLHLKSIKFNPQLQTLHNLTLNPTKLK